MTYDTVSVIIPTFNRAKTLERALKSILNQTIDVCEIFVCDDGSTDNSKEIVTGINDQRIIWVPGRHSGLPAVPRNRGIKMARGNWVAFLDSDDWWNRFKLEKQIKTLRETKNLACSTEARCFLKNKCIGRVVKFSEKDIEYKDLKIITTLYVAL